MNIQSERIISKLKNLKSLDRKRTIFGSNEHNYKLNPPISIKKLKYLESLYKIKFPADYFYFMTSIGNGGSGPFYGLYSIEETFDKNSIYQLSPSQEFLYTNEWNLKFEYDKNDSKIEIDKKLSKYEQYYDSDHHISGLIPICNYGCGTIIYLVVNGSEYGNIWTDDRTNDGGIHPSNELYNTHKINFYDWYELWLDKSIAELKDNNKSWISNIKLQLITKLSSCPEGTR